MQGRSFADQPPALTPAELDRLGAWGIENCSQSIFYRDGSCVMWLASRERARNREDFARAIRSVLKKLSIDASGLRRRRWLTLTEDFVVRTECAARAATDQPQGILPDTEVCGDEEDGVRLVPVGRRPV